MKNFNLWSINNPCYNIDGLNDIAKKDVKLLIKDCEKNFTEQLNNIAKNVKSKNIKMILIAGPSSAGKTTTSKLLAQRLLSYNLGSIVISLDDFFFDLKDTPLLEDGNPDFDNITTVDIKEFQKFYTTLLTQKKANKPIYNFVKQKRDEWETIKLNENSVIIVEGLHALNPILFNDKILEEQIYRIYINSHSIYRQDREILLSSRDLRLVRRIYRDYLTRDKSPVQTLSFWNNVCDAEDKYITPYKHLADYFIDTTIPYEILVYAHCFTGVLKKFENIDKIQEFINFFEKLTPISKTNIPENSLLWEFIVNREE